ncbi:conjugal transfer protein TraC [Aggregatibacter kilianii]|uniref:conjugal transfer protein TraC n=1 Tax=Aggregatibacter kilianii TaxID=2025884 RepID=UPI000D68AD87|nr:conjugal transfer protein TraC [Aggregatibacter kilianii]
MTLTQNKTAFYVMASIIAVAILSFAPDVFAGGLDEATSQASSIKTWAYKFLAVIASGYIIFNIVMAFVNKKSWGDVFMAVVYAAIAGAAVVLGSWAWSIWGS